MQYNDLSVSGNSVSILDPSNKTQSWPGHGTKVSHGTGEALSLGYNIYGQPLTGLATISTSLGKVQLSFQ